MKKRGSIEFRLLIAAAAAIAAFAICVLLNARHKASPPPLSVQTTSDQSHMVRPTAPGETVRRVIHITPDQPPIASPAAAAPQPPEIQFALLTADWCGPCKQFERDVLPAVREDLEKANKPPIVEVNVDKQPQAAEVLLTNADKSIPQIVAFQTEPGCESVDPAEPGACGEVQLLDRMQVAKHSREEIKAFFDREHKKPENRAAAPANATERRRLFRRR